MSEVLYTVVVERAWHPDHYGGPLEYEIIESGLTVAEADDLERRINDEIEDRAPIDLDDRWCPDYEDVVIVLTDAEARNAEYRRAA